MESRGGFSQGGVAPRGGGAAAGLREGREELSAGAGRGAVPLLGSGRLILPLFHVSAWIMNGANRKMIFLHPPVRRRLHSEAGQPPPVALQCSHAGFAAGEGGDVLVDGEVELDDEGGEVRRGGAEEAAQRCAVAVEEAVVEVLVLRMRRRRDSR